MNGQRELLIEPGRTAGQYWRDIWLYRELFLFLAWRDILVRYKQTVIGIIWSLLRPLLTMIVFTVVFSKLARLPSDGIPYPVMVYCGMIPWQFFSNALSESSNSLIDNANLLTKVYFPRIIVPASSVVVSLVDFAISLVILGGLLLWYGIIPDWRICLLPLFLVQALVFAFGCGLWISALNVQYRDFRYVIPFAVQFGLYISPVGFTSSIVPEQWRLLYSLNPMVGVIEGFRWAIAGQATQIYWPGYLLSLALILIISIGGFFWFRRMERTFADTI
ncbi:O-antigen export system permease protein RfbA [Geobacter sp. OR-1]|uniref:ABC transporter permease n=1 Tax=Geobacter sp. OR-1 TaxID=1266765 RepID=UPI0005427E80|nr:ABC transporter permease [Geobacter sp. OR-1]GAM11527.1 O-antigen export system permease protein RfbA [Geobacter sp. OR-1]